MRLSHLLATSILGAGLLLTPAAAAPAKPAAPPAAAEAPALEPGSVEALERMSSYLRTLQGFEMTADLLTDEVLDDGRKIQLASTATYKVRKPDRFALELVSDRKVRELYYNGKTITLFAPRAGFYAQASAPPTIRETLDVLADKGVEVPLEDLFRWGEPGDSRDRLIRGFYVGPAHIKGVETDQYAFSTAELDWQIWIERGDKPAPRKIVITSVFDDAEPQFVAEMAWNTAPPLSEMDFTFTPPAQAKTIVFASTAPQ